MAELRGALADTGGVPRSTPPLLERPRLVVFYGERSGPSRRVEAYLSQVLQRRQNHDTFRLIRVCAERRADLVELFSVKQVPSLFVVQGRRVRARLDAPRGRQQIERALAPWLK
jgi:thioredoxin-like negative regulator of GroEL